MTVIDGREMKNMGEHVRAAADLLKALSHESRLMIFCHLADGEKTVGELEKLTSLRQASVSQQLARLRLDGLVNARREGRTIYYSLGSEEAKRVIALVHNLYCDADS